MMYSTLLLVLVTILEAQGQEWVTEKDVSTDTAQQLQDALDKNVNSESIAEDSFMSVAGSCPPQTVATRNGPLYVAFQLPQSKFGTQITFEKGRTYRHVEADDTCYALSWGAHSFECDETTGEFTQLSGSWPILANTPANCIAGGGLIVNQDQPYLQVDNNMPLNCPGKWIDLHNDPVHVRFNLPEGWNTTNKVSFSAGSVGKRIEEGSCMQIEWTDLEFRCDPSSVEWKYVSGVWKIQEVLDCNSWQPGSTKTVRTDQEFLKVVDGTDQQPCPRQDFQQENGPLQVVMQLPGDASLGSSITYEAGELYRWHDGNCFILQWTDHMYTCDVFSGKWRPVAGSFLIPNEAALRCNGVKGGNVLNGDQPHLRIVDSTQTHSPTTAPVVTLQPTLTPNPSSQPTWSPVFITPNPSSQPTLSPVFITPNPSIQPTRSPVFIQIQQRPLETNVPQQPTLAPVPGPSKAPLSAIYSIETEEAPEPTVKPTMSPSSKPTTASPTSKPPTVAATTAVPATPKPTIKSPSQAPSTQPSTSKPTSSPSPPPSLRTPILFLFPSAGKPTLYPSYQPSIENDTPTLDPSTPLPSKRPSFAPSSESLTPMPSSAPSRIKPITPTPPTAAAATTTTTTTPAMPATGMHVSMPLTSSPSTPFVIPAAPKPTVKPTLSPSSKPTTASPTSKPPTNPSHPPSIESESPTYTPSHQPSTETPTLYPWTTLPSKRPSFAPSSESLMPMPSSTLSHQSYTESETPTLDPSTPLPSKRPSFAPSSENLSPMPSSAPSRNKPTPTPPTSPSSVKPTLMPSLPPSSRKPTPFPSPVPSTRKPTPTPSPPPSTGRPPTPPPTTPPTTLTVVAVTTAINPTPRPSLATQRPALVTEQLIISPTITKSPTSTPTPKPSVAPSQIATELQTTTPTTETVSIASPTSTPAHCGCSLCTDQIWNRTASGYSCGQRIDYIVNIGGGSPLDACRQVSGEFPEICGPYCHPDICTTAVNSKPGVTSGIVSTSPPSPAPSASATLILITDAENPTTNLRVVTDASEAIELEKALGWCVVLNLMVMLVAA